MPAYKVLVFEQDKVSNYLEVLLRNFGYKVSCVNHNLDLLLQESNQIRPDLILMDFNHENGKNAIDISKKIYKNIGTSFIYLAENDEKSNIVDDSVKFQYAILNKPFRKKELQIAIESLIDKNKLDKKIREFQNLYNYIINNINDCVITTDTSGKIVGINKTALKLLGIEEKGTIGKDVSTVLAIYSSDKGVDRIDLSLNQTFSSSLNEKFFLKCTDDSYIQIKNKVVPLLSEINEACSGYMFVFYAVPEDKSERLGINNKVESQNSNADPESDGSVSIGLPAFTDENLEELSKLSSRAFILNSVLDITYKSEDIDQVINTILELLYNNLEYADFISVYFTNNQKAQLKASAGIADDYIESFNILDYSKGLPWASILSGEVSNIVDVTKSEFLTDSEKEIGIKCCLSIPLKENGITIGSLNLYSIQKEDVYGENEVNLLENVCKHIEIVCRAYIKSGELRQSEQRFQNLFEKSPVGVFLMDSNFRISQCNKRVAEIMRSTFDKIIGFDVREIGDEKFLASVRKMLKGNYSRCEFSYEIKHKDTRVWLLASLSPLKNQRGEIEGGMVVLEDISERKGMENAIIEEKERLSITLRSIGDGVITVDSDRKVILMNKIAENITEWLQKDAFSKKVEDILTLDNQNNSKSYNNIFRDTIIKGKAVNITEDLYFISKNNNEKLLNISSSPIHDNENNVIGAVIVFRDTTERYKFKQELLKAQKLESLETLAGGIAHDFNNMLTGIIGNLSLSRMYVDSDDKIYKRLAEAERECFRAADLTKQLINFAEGIPPNKKITSITELVDESISFVLTGSRVKSEFSSVEDIWLVEVDERQIMQVIYDLALNSLQAMPGGGKIKTSVRNINIEESQNNIILSGEYVKISIEDTGLGISKENLPKIYDPYFTTKDDHAGLGLSNSYSIIKSHGGFIGVDSQDGKGTKVNIYIPARNDVIPLEEEVVHQPLEDLKEGQRGKILVMDDDEVVREIVGAILNYIGYDVAFASDGREAIDLYVTAKEKGEKFDVIIMDLTIPGGMGADDAIKQLIDIDPEVKAIVSSGYSNAPVISNFAEFGFKGAITKPYRIEELTKTVKDVLLDKNINTLPI